MLWILLMLGCGGGGEQHASGPVRDAAPVVVASSTDTDQAVPNELFEQRDDVVEVRHDISAIEAYLSDRAAQHEGTIPSDWSQPPLEVYQREPWSHDPLFLEELARLRELQTTAAGEACQ